LICYFYIYKLEPTTKPKRKANQRQQANRNNQAKAKKCREQSRKTDIKFISHLKNKNDGILRELL
jgi:hypothetical protein